ncbi:hypothetical protein, conserved [Babesia ovata]|uniref:6-Cys domain-containing protein n=1 Tax=Babesia ovata TaxID=189622 RepID=A0A2H6K6W1_9APIC|nr:uncharacterized protein BOVATA_002300 [Babesia ovata]GBE58737.1 hypothetical protein, conserved [Babesia ovata]
MDIDDFGSATVICPRQVNDTEYVWHPQPNSGGNGFLNTYGFVDGKLRSVALSDVVITDEPGDNIWVESNEAAAILNFNLRDDDDIYVVTERRSIFICGPRDMILSDALQRHLDGINGTIQAQGFPWSPSTPLTQEINKIGSGLGVFFMYRGRVHMPLQGCGSRPSPLFAPDNEVTVDPVTGTRSCVVDPISEARIGFVCEGRIEPDDCMRYLLDTNGDVVRVPPPYPHLSFDFHRPWVVTQYFSLLALPPINGECKCLNPKTGQVNAKIEIRSKADYVCDISSKLFRNRSQPIRGPWCSVILQPGGSLTIRLPIKNVYAEPADEEASTVTFSQMMSLYEYETEFRPEDLTTLRQLSVPYDVDMYNEIPYHSALVGDALELDVSQMHRGEVKLKYHSGKPLALRSGLNSFFYNWTLKSRNKNVLERISAIVNVSFAFTHYYDIVGCDLGTQSLFDPEKSKSCCSTKSMENGIGSVYECLYHETPHVGWVGIRCGPNEELLPNNCESTGYDLYSNQITPFPKSLRSDTPYPIGGFQMFRMDFQDTAIGYACICVDQRGYETSKLILEYNKNTFYRYKVYRPERSHTSLPYILLPWREIGLSIEGFTSPESVMIRHVPQTAITIQAGKTLSLYCELDLDALQGILELLNIHRNSARETLKWLPERPDEFYYAVERTPNGPEFVRRRYIDSMAATQAAFEVVYQANPRSPRYPELTIKTRRSAVLISKEPLHKQYVPMTFLCGKLIEPADVSITAGDVPTSSTANVVRSAVEYTWNIVNVNVETTDPYMQGCGVTYSSDELFKPETPPLYGGDGKSQFGCKVDLQAAKEAAFYCPAPYVLDPPNCFSQVYVDGEVTNLGGLSQSLSASRSNHFVILEFNDSLVGPGEALRQTPPLECRCVTVKGAVLSTIQIENYYSK